MTLSDLLNAISFLGKLTTTVAIFCAVYLLLGWLFWKE